MISVSQILANGNKSHLTNEEIEKIKTEMLLLPDKVQRILDNKEEIQKFAIACKKYIPHVVFTVVDCIGEEEIKACQKVCDNLNIPLRVRAFEANQ